MKKFYNYTFQLVCIYILVLALFSIFNFDLTKTNYNKTVHNVDEEKVLDSTLLVQNLEETEDEGVEEESINEEDSTDEVEQETETVEEVFQPVEISNVNVLDVSSYSALASETVNMSHYGHDCSGCGSYTASGYYIGDGRTYYNDSTFGSVRIVAADYKYPEGTILRISYNGNSFAAIVLDRGGIGDNAKYQLDLLASSESEALNLGVVYGAYVEVLRYGY